MECINIDLSGTNHMEAKYLTNLGKQAIALTKDFVELMASYKLALKLDLLPTEMFTKIRKRINVVTFIKLETHVYFFDNTYKVSYIMYSLFKTN